MFKSKLRPIVIPQSEHQRLAGALALLWGNSFFERPQLPFTSLIAGIGLHDRAYGELDPFPIGELPEDEWLKLTRHGFYMPWSDPAADLITKLHLKRLVSWVASPERQALLAEMEHVIDRQVEQNALSRTEFDRIDRLTDFCDSVSFDFCFEQPGQGAVTVFPKNDSEGSLSVRYIIEAGKIQIDPWPFSVESYTGYLVGYDRNRYPNLLEPVIVPYRLAKATQE
jgi:hypothetical protein